MRHRPIFFVGAFGALLSGCGGSGGGSSTPTEPVLAPPSMGSGQAGLVNGTYAEARFSNPANVAVGPKGIVYVADFDNDAVRRIDSLAATTSTSAVETAIKQDDFSRPFGLAIASDGTLYVQTDANDEGGRDSTTGTVWRYPAAGGSPTVVARNLGRPRGLLVLPDGDLILSDLVRNTISRLHPATGTTTLIAGTDGVAGFVDGTGAAAQFSRPYGLARLADGSLLVADQGNNRLRKVTLDGVVTTFAGTGAEGLGNGSRSTATFRAPQAISVAPDGTIYVADQGNHVIRKIVADTVSTFAGDGKAGYAGGQGLNARFYGLEGISLDSAHGKLWIADGNNGDGTDHNRVRDLSVP